MKTKFGFRRFLAASDRKKDRFTDIGEIFVAKSDAMMTIFRHIIGAMAGLAIFTAASAQVKTDGKTTEIGGTVRFDKMVHDFGDVQLSSGALTCTFTLTNISSSAVVIYNVVSSCGCTDVKWSREPVLPGKTGTITATYSNDEGAYPFDKTLTAYISGIKKPVILRLRGIVHDKKLSLGETYPVHRGSLGLKKESFDLGNLSQGSQKSDGATIANIGSNPIRISFKDVSDGLAVSVSPNPVPAHQTAKMTYIVTADRSRWGRNFYYATPVVNGAAAGGKLKFQAFTKEDFSAMTPLEQNNAAYPIFDESSFEFGKVAKGQTVKATFTYRNMGDTVLKIYKADSEIPALSLPANFKDVQSGETGSFSCSLDTRNMKKGENAIAILLTTNSPLRPVVSLYVAGTIE